MQARRFLDKVVGKQAHGASFPKWMLYEFHEGGLIPSAVHAVADRVLQHSRTSERHERVSEAVAAFIADGSNMPKTLFTSLASFIKSVHADKTAKLECIGRAKAVAFICEVMGEPYTLMGNETHMYVIGHGGRVYDFRFNLKYADELMKKKRVRPSYYFQAIPLDDNAMLSTVLLDNKELSAIEKLARIKTVYPSPAAALDQAPVWVRVFMYEQEEHLNVFSDSEALTHPFVCLNFAELLDSIPLLRQALVALECRGYEYDMDFFYDNEDKLSVLDVVRRMAHNNRPGLSEDEDELRPGLSEDELRSILDDAHLRAQQCTPAVVAERFKKKSDVLFEEKFGISQKRKRGNKEAA